MIACALGHAITVLRDGRIEVDGETVDGNIIPLPSEPGGIVEVRARIEG